MGTTFQKPKKDIYKEKSGHQSGAAKRSIIGCPEESMGFSIGEIIGDYCLSKYNSVGAMATLESQCKVRKFK